MKGTFLFSLVVLPWAEVAPLDGMFSPCSQPWGCGFISDAQAGLGHIQTPQPGWCQETDLPIASCCGWDRVLRSVHGTVGCRGHVRIRWGALLTRYTQIT